MNYLRLLAISIAAISANFIYPRPNLSERLQDPPGVRCEHAVLESRPAYFARVTAEHGDMNAVDIYMDFQPADSLLDMYIHTHYTPDYRDVVGVTVRRWIVGRPDSVTGDSTILRGSQDGLLLQRLFVEFKQQCRSS